MKEMFLRPHLGLGDHIICNGMVRHFSQNYKIYMPCKKHNVVSVSYMFGDLPNVEIIPVDNDAHANSLSHTFRDKGCKIIMLGEYGKDFHINSKDTFDRVFYRQAGLDYSVKWDKFSVPRNIESEKSFFDKHYGFNEPFAFVHEDKDRNYLIRKDMLHASAPMVCPSKKLADNIFIYCWILENAIQIDCLDSSFANLADLLILKAGIKRIHMYARPDTVLPSHIQSWEYIQ